MINDGNDIPVFIEDRTIELQNSKLWILVLLFFFDILTGILFIRLVSNDIETFYFNCNFVMRNRQIEWKQKIFYNNKH